MAPRKLTGRSSPLIEPLRGWIKVGGGGPGVTPCRGHPSLSPPRPPAPARHPPQRPVPRGWCSRGRCLLEQRVALMRVLAALCPLFPPPQSFPTCPLVLLGGCPHQGGRPPSARCPSSRVPRPPAHDAAPLLPSPAPWAAPEGQIPLMRGCLGPRGSPIPRLWWGGPSPGCPVAVASLPSSNPPPESLLAWKCCIYKSIFFLLCNLSMV